MSPRRVAGRLRASETLRRSDDATLVQAAKDGDRQALEQLLRRHQDRIYGLCRRLASNDADGSDAAQEALVAIVRGLHRFDGRSRFSTWAYRVATNAALDELRRRSRRPVLALADDERLHAAVSADPAEMVGRLDLDAALTALPKDFRVPVILRDVIGCDYAEIAAILEIPPGTVRSRIARGRAKLADTMRAAGNHDIGARRLKDGARRRG